MKWSRFVVTAKALGATEMLHELDTYQGIVEYNVPMHIYFEINGRLAGFYNIAESAGTIFSTHKTNWSRRGRKFKKITI